MHYTGMHGAKFVNGSSQPFDSTGFIGRSVLAWIVVTIALVTCAALLLALWHLNKTLSLERAKAHVSGSFASSLIVSCRVSILRCFVWTKTIACFPLLLALCLQFRSRLSLKVSRWFLSLAVVNVNVLHAGSTRNKLSESNVDFLRMQKASANWNEIDAICAGIQVPALLVIGLLLMCSQAEVAAGTMSQAAATVFKQFVAAARALASQVSRFFGLASFCLHCSSIYMCPILA